MTTHKQEAAIINAGINAGYDIGLSKMAIKSSVGIAFRVLHPVAGALPKVRRRHVRGGSPFDKAMMEYVDAGFLLESELGAFGESVRRLLTLLDQMEAAHARAMKVFVEDARSGGDG